MQRLGRYEVLGELAIGGMAEILLGRMAGPRGFERVVVIKRILPHLARQPAFVDMFLDEARTVARLHHPNVVHVQELVAEGSDLYMVMEYLDGESVAALERRLLVTGEPLDAGLAAHIVAEACRGLHAAHELGDGEIPLDIVHRDVSPQNLFVSYDGVLKVLDFGIARSADRIARTEAGQVKGKLSYMSPEQCAGKVLDRRSDIFSLGTVLHELLTGRQLFKRSSDLLTFRAICEEPVPAPSALRDGVPASLDAVCARALQRRREDRYPTAAAMRADLLAAMAGGHTDLDGELARTMQRLFAARMELKADMLRRARGLAEVPHVPPAEPDADVELPTMERTGPPATSSDVRPAHLPLPAQAPRSRRWLRWAAGGGALVAAASVALMRLPSTTPSSAAEPASTSTPAPTTPPASDTAAPSAAPAAASAVDAAAASPATISIHVESTPAGALVAVDGAPVGRTPLDAPLTRGSTPAEVVLTLPGFQPLRTRVVPDVDQRMLLTLQAAPRAAHRPAPRSAAPRVEKLP
jgi:eukaryotic-like serine/threonine-protein kinase